MADCIIKYTTAVIQHIILNLNDQKIITFLKNHDNCKMHECTLYLLLLNKLFYNVKCVNFDPKVTIKILTDMF